jgi:hypothetical protein
MEINKLDNLLLNLLSGLLPKDLSKSEIVLLQKEFGENWFEELGYNDNYEKPINPIKS